MLIKSKDVNAMCILKNKEVIFAYIAGMIYMFNLSFTITPLVPLIQKKYGYTVG